MTDNKQYYERIERKGGSRATIYGKISHRFPFLKATTHEVCRDLVTTGQKTILDIGCEDGDFLFLIADKFGECHGIDISDEMITQAKAKANARADASKFSFTQLDADLGLPFPDNAFDTVSCMNVLEHVFNPPHLLKEIGRVMSVNGELLIAVPNLVFFPFRIKLLAGDFPRTTGGPLDREWEHLHYYTLSLLRRLLEENGFKMEKTACSGIFSKPRSLNPSLLGADLIVLTRKN